MSENEQPIEESSSVGNEVTAQVVDGESGLTDANMDTIDDILAEALGGTPPDSAEDSSADDAQGEAAPAESENLSDDGPNDDGPEDEPEQTDHVAEDKDIDYDMQIPMPDGFEPKTLGELKDLATDHARRELALQKRETEAMAEAQEMSQLLRQMPREQIPDEVREAAAKREEAHMMRQFDLMLEAIPEMQTQAGFETVKGRVSDKAAQYGFTPEEMGHISDPRVVKVLDDFAKLEAAVNESKLTVEKIRKTASKKGRPAVQKRDSQDVTSWSDDRLRRALNQF